MRNDLKYLNIHKKLPSISMPFSVSCFVFFLLDFSENNGPGGGVLARFFCPRDGDFALSLCPEGGELAV